MDSQKSEINQKLDKVLKSLKLRTEDLELENKLW